MVNRQDLIARGLLEESMNYMEALADFSFEQFEKCKKWNVINPHIELEVLEMTKEKESHKFYTKWEESLQKPDPNYNVNLKMEENKIFRMNG